MRETCLPSAWIFSSSVRRPWMWAIAAPALTASTYCAATPGMSSCGGQRWFCGYDVRESPATVMISLSMNFLLLDELVNSLFGSPHSPFVPAQAGTQGQFVRNLVLLLWVPACAGTNGHWAIPRGAYAPVLLHGHACGRRPVRRHCIRNPALSMISLYIGTSRAIRARNAAGPSATTV